MASNFDKRLREIENSGHHEGVLRAKQFSSAAAPQSVKKQVFGELKNLMRSQEASATPYAAGKSSSGERRNDAQLQQPPKQNNCSTALSLELELPAAVPDEIDYYLIDCMDARTCCSDLNYKPDWSVWAEMTGREFEDSGVCGTSFSFREDANDSLLGDASPPRVEDLDDTSFDEALLLIDSMLLGKDLDVSSIQLDLPEVSSYDSFYDFPEDFV